MRQSSAARVRAWGAAGSILLAFALVPWNPALGDAPETGNTPQRIPHGQGILLNGFIGSEEWDDQNVLITALCDTVEFRLKQDSQYVYIGVRSLDTNHTGIDLYLGGATEPWHLLHVSTAHSQADLAASAGQESIFGQNRLWAANVVQMFFEDDERRIVAPELFEFQIGKEMIKETIFRLMVRFKRPARACPAGAKPDNPSEWIEFSL
jgi:hypothetical protein